MNVQMRKELKAGPNTYGAGKPPGISGAEDIEKLG